MKYGWVEDDPAGKLTASGWAEMPVWETPEGKHVSVYVVSDSSDDNGGVNPRYKMRCIGPVVRLVREGVDVGTATFGRRR